MSEEFIRENREEELKEEFVKEPRRKRTPSIRVHSEFKKLYKSEKTRIIEESGRNSGKTFHNIDYCISRLIGEKDCDIVLMRAFYGDIASSMYRLFKKRIVDLGLDKLFIEKANPMSFTCKINQNKVWFACTNAKQKSDLTATKGFEPLHHIGVVWLDEADQSYSGEHIREAEATFNRFIKKGSKYIYSYNKPLSKLHWAHKFFKEMYLDNNTERVYTTWEDIRSELTPATIKMIENFRESNPEYYKWRYLNEMVSLNGLIYSQFDKEREYLDKEGLIEITKRSPIKFVTYGIDPAVTKDSTAILCSITLRDNKTILLSGYKYNPVTNELALSPARQALLCSRFVERMELKYGLREYPRFFIVDCANQELLLSFQELGYENCLPYTKKDFWSDTNRVQDCFDLGMLYIYNEVYHYDIYNNKEVEGVLLVDEIDSYSYDPETNDCYKDAEDHLIACMRYVVGFVYSDKSILINAQDSKYR